jgi:hypothetical protein
MTLAAVLAGALASLAAAWSNVHDYRLTIDAHEVLDGRTQTQVLSYAFRAPDRARLEVLSGPEYGAIVVWYGGADAIAYRRGLALFKLHAPARDPRLTSLRGNGVLTPDFAAIIGCFEAHADRVHELPGPAVDGQATVAIVLAHGGVDCSTDSAVDRAVTRDILFVSRRTNLPVLRARYVAEQLVERWQLKGLRTNEALGDSDFR